MSAIPDEFPRLNVQPFELMKESWELIKPQYWLFVGIVFVGMLVGNAVPLVLMGPMLCGMSLCYLGYIREERVAFETLFKGFDHFAESLIATLILSGIYIGVSMVLGILAVGVAVVLQAQFLVSVVIGLAALGMVAVSLATWGVAMLAHPLICDRGMKAVPALKASVAACQANLGTMALVLLTMMFLYAGGLAACYFGLFLVLPIIFGAGILLYRELFPDQDPEPELV